MKRWYAGRDIVVGRGIAIATPQPFVRPVMAFDGANLWVTGYNDQGITVVTKVRPSDGTILGSFPTGGTTVESLISDGDHLYASHDWTHSISKIDARSGAIVWTQNGIERAQGLAFDGRSLWVTSTGLSHLLTKVNAVTGDIVAQYQLPMAANVEPIWDGHNLWMASLSTGSLSRVRTSDGATLDLFGEFGASGLAFDGANMWIGQWSTSSLRKRRGSDGASLGEFDVGVRPTTVLFDGSSVWVGSSVSGTVVKVRPSDGEVLGTFVHPSGAAAGPIELAFDGISTWVAFGGVGVIQKM